MHDGDQVGEIPLTGPRAVPPVAPAVVTALAPAELGTTSLTFGTPQVEAYSDRHVVGIPIHAVNNDRYDASFSDREFRMLIYGDPRAPVGFLGEVIPAMASADATLWWEVPLGSGSLVLPHRASGSPGRGAGHELEQVTDVPGGGRQVVSEAGERLVLHRVERDLKLVGEEPLIEVAALAGGPRRRTLAVSRPGCHGAQKISHA